MCLTVYVSSDLALPESTWKEERPAFYLQLVAKTEAVRRQFQHEFVYYAGSHEGCGCGYMKDGRDSAELVTCQENYAALGAVLSKAILQGAKLQLFTCWEGEQAASPTTTGDVEVEEIVSPEFELQQLSLLAVVSDA